MSNFIARSHRVDIDDPSLIEVFAVERVEANLFRENHVLRHEFGPWFGFYSVMMSWTPDHRPQRGSMCDLSWNKFAEPYPHLHHRWVRWYEIKVGDEFVLAVMSPHQYKNESGITSYYDHRFSVRASKKETAALVLLFAEHIISETVTDGGNGWSAFQTGVEINELF